MNRWTFVLCAIVFAVGARPCRATDLDSQLEAWRAEHGQNWSVAVDHSTGMAEMLFGGSVQLGSSEDDPAVLAFEALLLSQSMHAVDPATLVLVSSKFLPLGQIGSTDKYAVSFRQSFNEVPVVQGHVNVLLSTDGGLLAIQSIALPGISEMSTVATIGPELAEAIASDLLSGQTGHASVCTVSPSLAVEQVIANGTRVAELVWRLEVASATEAGMDIRAFSISALDGSVVRENDASFHAPEVRGTVYANATPGIRPDISCSNPPSQYPGITCNDPIYHIMRYMDVVSSAGTVVTDEDGFFVIAGVNTPLACTFRFRGPYSNARSWQINQTCASTNFYELTLTLDPNTDNEVFLNSSPAANVTSQANAFYARGVMIDFVRQIDPTETLGEVVICATTNTPGIGSADSNGQVCDPLPSQFYARFGQAGTELGGSTYYFNLAYSTVVSHEYGHILNSVFNTCNYCDGMGEGNASVWAMYAWDTAFIGLDYAGPSTVQASGLNTRQFCGDEPVLQDPEDCNCYGQVHDDGEVWLGAAWKVRAYLNATLGNSQGDLAANSIFLAWMQTYDQQRIKSIIETQWLTLDDDNGNLLDGTPHCADIDAGFTDQGFPGVTCN